MNKWLKCIENNECSRYTLIAVSSLIRSVLKWGGETFSPQAAGCVLCLRGLLLFRRGCRCCRGFKFCLACSVGNAWCWTLRKLLSHCYHGLETKHYHGWSSLEEKHANALLWHYVFLTVVEAGNLSFFFFSSIWRRFKKSSNHEKNFEADRLWNRFPSSPFRRISAPLLCLAAIWLGRGWRSCFHFPIKFIINTLKASDHLCSFVIF